MSGLYIHIPFCRQACTYCDFHFSTSTQTIDLLVTSLKKELTLRKNYIAGDNVETVYFGGGTPSILKSSDIQSLLNTIRSEFILDNDAEITLEANPDDLTSEKCDELISAGINRLSIGIQSFADEDLRFMNRAHNALQAISSVKNAKQSGFENISIDLIYGIQQQEENRWEKNLDIAFNLDVSHLSCYALTVEPRTALADMIRKKKIPGTDDEKTISEFGLLMKRATEDGFEHYEISNFAKNGKYSRHNTSYWRGKKYLGIGPSAHSFDNQSRQWNISNNREYIRMINENILPFEKEELTMANKFNEYILTSLRTMWGVDVSFVEKKFGQFRKEELLRQISNYVKDGMITSSNTNNFILSEKGKYFADRIAAALFE